MEKFIYLMKMTFMTKLAYVKAFWINIAGTFASIVIYYFLWQFVFRQQDSLAGYTAAEMTAYVILSRMLSSQFSGGINYELSNWIRTGMIGTELLRPVSLFFTLFAKRAGEFVFFALFKGAPIALVSFLILGGTAPAGFIGILAIASAVGTMGGWGIYEICLMFSMCAFIESLSQTFFDNVWEINGLVHRGRMDVFLVRPASVFFQLLGDVMHYPALMSMTIYAGAASVVWRIGSRGYNSTGT